MGRILAIALLTTFAVAAPASGAPKDPLVGHPEIEKVLVLHDSDGAGEDSVLVWVRVDQALVAGSAQADAKNVGEVFIDVDGPEGHATGNQRLRLSLVNPVKGKNDNDAGYGIELAPKEAQSLGEGKLRISIRAEHSLDADGDHDVDDTGRDAESVVRAPTSIASPFVPADGLYTSAAWRGLISFKVKEANLISFSSKLTDCRVATTGSAPINPTDGSFEYHTQDRSVGGYLRSDVVGTFSSSTSASARVHIHSPASPRCEYGPDPGYPYSLAG
jgi:hypothetical protein